MKERFGDLDSLRPHLLEDALLELRPRAEELLVGGGGRLVGVFEGGQLHRADVVTNLAEPVVRGRGQPIDHHILRKRVVHDLADCPRDRFLSSCNLASDTEKAEGNALGTWKSA